MKLFATVLAMALLFEALANVLPPIAMEGNSVVEASTAAEISPRGRPMILRPRRRMKPSKAKTALPVIPETVENRMKRDNEYGPDPFATLRDVPHSEVNAMSNEELPIERFPKRSRNRVSEGF
uniref:Uncharacterized protein n=1 Tax=Panagrellus redivivus TaxID=6233 RepID=A0A7E4V159_PANRE